MAISTLVWKLASPYDAYVSHVARLEMALERVRHFSERALAYEVGLQGSLRIVASEGDSVERTERFREQMGTAASEMSDEEFEEFIEHVGGGIVADVEADRAKTASRLGHTTRGLEEYFALAGKELAVLEQRGYNPKRPDVARQLRDNRLPLMSLAEYRHMLHELGARVGQKTK